MQKPIENVSKFSDIWEQNPLFYLFYVNFIRKRFEMIRHLYFRSKRDFIYK